MILEIQNGSSNDKSILIELCKRTFNKIYRDTPGNLENEHNKLVLLVDEITRDPSILAKFETSVPLSTDQFNLIDCIINSNPDLKNLDVAAELCLNYLKTIAYVDSRAWSTFLSIAKKAYWDNDRMLHALSIIQKKNDERGINYALVALKIQFSNCVQEDESDLLFDYCMNLISKPSTLSDVVNFVKITNDDERQRFYFKIIRHIDSVDLSIFRASNCFRLKLMKF